MITEEEIKIIIVITIKYNYITVYKHERSRMYNGPQELIYIINGSRRKALVASIMEIQVMYV